MKVLILCLVALVSAVYAENLQCPNKSRGQYPKCQCLNGATYDATYNWCATDLKELIGECPIDGAGVFPNCRCGIGKLFDKYTNMCATVNRNICPDGATGWILIEILTIFVFFSSSNVNVIPFHQVNEMFNSQNT